MRSDAKLMSIGSVDESGEHKFYAEPSEVGEFAQREVIPKLEGGASRLPMVTLRKYLAAWIKGLHVPVMLATDSVQGDWPCIETLLKQRWPQNLARDPLLLTTEYLYEFDAFEAAREATFASGLRRHHALDDALANRQAWYTSGGDFVMLAACLCSKRANAKTQKRWWRVYDQRVALGLWGKAI